MRMMLKVTIPVDKGNTAIKDGSLVKKIQSILADLKPVFPSVSGLNFTRNTKLL